MDDVAFVVEEVGTEDIMSLKSAPADVMLARAKRGGANTEVGRGRAWLEDKAGAGTAKVKSRKALEAVEVRTRWGGTSR